MNFSALKNYNFDMLTGKTFPVFLYYTIPWVMGLLISSSASLIDGAFLGKYVGSSALAAVNLVIPVTTLVFSIAIMMAVGGSVRAGKYLGEEKPHKANAVFTKTVVSVVVILSFLVAALFIFRAPIIDFLGADENLLPLTKEYFTWIVLFLPFLPVSIALSYFIRVDGKPVFASVGFAFGALINVILDYLLIVEFEYGVKGAAIATGTSHIFILVFLASHFFLKKNKIRLTKQVGEWKEILQASFNGFSEFTNESSIALVTLLFNNVVISQLGAEGVAAFSVINYILFVGLMISYGISDSLHPIISVNLGAEKFERISSFLKTAVLSTFCLGLISIILLHLSPEMILNIFIHESDAKTFEIAMDFVSFFWPAFLFNGINITFSGYFTAMHKPVQSIIASLSRSLIFPVILIIILPKIFNNPGIYSAIPAAEFISFIITLWLFVKFNKIEKSVSA